MQTINLTDKEALITQIKTSEGVTTVELAWGGLDECEISNFDIARLGKLASGIGEAFGGDLTSGWVILDGPCLLSVGDTILRE